jgi:hypothetical protein
MRYLLLGFVVICAVGLVAIGVEVHDSPTQSFNFDQSATSPSLRYRAVGLGVFMIIGVFCGHLYRWMGHDDAAISARSLLSSLRDKSLWQSLLASPLVFMVVYALAEKQPDYLIASILAFENGFLANVVIKKRIPTGNEANPDTPPDGSH